eukprot:6982848-Pyramimonas_sp.AAC.1
MARKKCRSMPLLASIVAARCPRARIRSSAPFALGTAFCGVVVKSNRPVGVEYFGKSELHLALL